MPTIPDTFTAKKQRILDNLSRPDEQYSDLSPKGSVDAGVKDLITIINSVDGLVTTSSCAGRISVFLEGSKSDPDDPFQRNATSQIAVPGGKGRGGRWLFVSHDPVDLSTLTGTERDPIAKLFNMSGQQQPLQDLDIEKTRFIKLQFEPMILHIMAATLGHAQPILAAAINAGFRESGVQSLKYLDDPNACPMVAIRSSGLALSSLIGFADDTCELGVQCLVSESHLAILLSLANARFEANAERIGRLKDQLTQIKAKHRRPCEDKEQRKERNRALGLEKRRVLIANSTRRMFYDDSSIYSVGSGDVLSSSTSARSVTR